MTDLHIQSNTRFPFAAAFFAALGIALVTVGALSEEIGFVVGSSPCWTLAICLFFARPASFEATLSDEGIALQNTGQLISYDSISYAELIAEYRSNNTYSSKPAPIRITHDFGELVIPARLNHSSLEVYNWISERITPRLEYSLHSDLEEFAEAQRETFAEDKVFCFCARENVKPSRVGKRVAWAVFTGLVLGGIPWIVTGVERREEGWFVGTVFLGLAAFVALLVALIRGRSTAYGIKDWRLSGLVISPFGIALMQGPLKGRMRWDEIHSVTFGSSAKAFQLSHSGSNPKGILLKFDGGRLNIVDIYNQPLPIISRLIRDYWSGEEE